MQKHMLRSPELLMQKKSADNSSGLSRIRDAAWIKIAEICKDQGKGTLFS